MHYADLCHLAPDKFKRLTGFHPDVFNEMLACLNEKGRNFGRPSKLTKADQLLLATMYWREYRTLYHIATTFGVSEATACRTVQKVEDTLLASGRFRLPGKKALREAALTFSVVVLDSSESPIERPKKSSTVTTAAKPSVTRSKVR
jgi:hypothetical protein